jgi:hypothetical protein
MLEFETPGAFANYSNGYCRLFAPGHAVGAVTERVLGFVDMGHGGAVDGWTAAADYLPRQGRTSPRFCT